MLCYFLLYSKVNQPHVYTYPLPFGPTSYSPLHPTPEGHHRVLSRAPRAIQPFPTSYLFFTQYSIYVSATLSTCLIFSFPLCVHMSVLCVYEVRFLSAEKSWDENLNQDTVNKACRKKRLSWTVGIIFLPLNQFLKKLKLSFNFKWCFPSAFDFSKAITSGKKRVKVKVLISELCPTLCDPMDCSLPGSFVHGILQARIL